MASICKEIREMDDDAIKIKMLALKKELYGLVYKSKAGRIEKPHQIKRLKRDIARCETILMERKSQ